MANNIIKKTFRPAYRMDNKPLWAAFQLVCKRGCEPVAYKRYGPTWVLFILLLLISVNSTHASPQITLISPSTDIWTESNNVEFDVNITDPSPAYGFIDWPDSLVGWWRAEGNANDESESSNHGTFIGDASTTSGKFGQAFSFDGSGDSIDIGDCPEFDFHKTDSFTLSVWVNKDDNLQRDILQKGAFFRLDYHGTKWQFELGNSDASKYVYSSDSNPQGKWVHIEVVYNASNYALSMYIDGQHKMTDSSNAFGDFSNADVLKIGGGIYTEVDHKGLIDDVMIFSRALTAGEIKALYDATAQNLVTTFNDLDEMAPRSYEIYAINAAGEKATSGTRSITVDVPNSAPVVSLDSPLSPTRSSSTTQQFAISATDTNADTTLASATLCVDYGAGLIQEETITLTGDSDTAVFTKAGLEEGSITWNCHVTDSKGHSAFAETNHTLIIGQTDYYVAPYGDDSNPGTIDQPFQTVQRFANNALPGDTCYVRAGTYRETITPANSGNALAPITYKAYHGETVTISGADPLTAEWTQHQGAIYKTTMNWDLGLGNNQIFVDGKAMMEARWPDANDVMKANLLRIDSGTVIDNGSLPAISTATINDADLTQPVGFWDGAIVHAIWNPCYHAITGQVTSSSPGSLAITLHCRPDENINSAGKYYITCSYNALDKENEWFYDSDTSTLYLWAPESRNPSSYVVEAKKRAFAFDLRGKSYINIDTIDVFSSTITTDVNSHHINIDNMDATYVSHYTLIDEGSGAVGEKGTRDTGIILDGHDNIIMNSEIAYSAGNGVSLIGSNNTVHNCEIHAVNYVVTECAAVQTGSRKTQNNRITNSKLYNAGRSIIVHDKAQNLKILHNEMFDNAWEPWDCGATYAINTDGKGTEIAYNYVHDVTSLGIYFDYGNWNFNIHHNVIWNIFSVTDSGIHMNNPSVNNKVYNNTLGVGVWISTGSPSTMAGTEIKNNICYDLSPNYKPWPEDVTIENNIKTRITDACFVDVDVNDYHLLIGSPAIDAGLDLGFTHDVEGNPVPQGPAPDIGAYEYVLDPDNHTPVLQEIGNKSVDENVLLTFTVTATDEDAGDTISYSAQSLPSGATFSSQTFSWTPSYDQAGSYQVTFRATDGKTRDSKTITITVNNVNQAPVFGTIANQSVNETALLSFSVSATDADGQAITYSVSGLPSGAVFASQTFTWTPSYDQAGTYSVTFTADDGQAQDSQTITITVVNVNRAPVLTAIGNRTAYADVLFTFTIDATDPDGDAITYSAGTLPSGATFTDQDFEWTPSLSQVGNYAITFAASDGQLQDSEMVTLTVDVDSLAPTVTNLSPAADSIQVPLNNLITLNIADAGIGVEPKSVKIKVRINDNPNNTTVYFGDMDHDISLLGDCRRIGNNADYKFVFQPTQDLFYYDQTVTITVNATDLAGNVMNSYIYSFATEMHSFGQNKQVNSGLDNNDRPVTVCDSSGNIWSAWQAGPIDNRDIYISKLTAGEENFNSTIQLTNNANDQCNPAVALDSNDKLYVVWQDNRQGDWDIYISTSVDGISWSTETRVNDPNDGNQVNPAIVIDGQSPNYAHVVWQDDRADNQDICIATSSDGFATKMVSQITSDTFDQVEPAIAADSDNTIYVVWTDGRNGSNDIYGAASNNPWTNVAIVSNANNQSSPAIATESTGSILHLLWVDDTSGDNDIYYASSDGLPGSPLTGSSIIDDTSGADQLDPTIAVTGSTDNNLKVFACWQDWRNTDTDLYFAELSAGSGTNVFVGDSGSNAEQGKPVIGIDEYSHPYLIWADNRSTDTDIYYVGSTFIEPVALASELVTASASSSTIVGTDPQAITTVDDVSIVVPTGACSYDVTITVTKIANLPAFAAPCLGGYDFGPSGIQFSQPVTITIPYVFSGSDSSVTPYWFNSLTGALSQQGITDIQDITISSSLHALSFKTTHFTAFFLLAGGGAAAIVGGGGGGGGCSVSASGEGNIIEYILPYIALAVVMAILKMRDARNRKARNMTTGKC